MYGAVAKYFATATFFVLALLTGGMFYGYEVKSVWE
jgi:hypothetical protein